MPKADILLIDDEEALRIAAEKILAREGYRVTTFGTAKEGLAKLATDGADVVITDLFLPDIDGMEVIRRARESQPTIELIMITGHGTVEKAVEAMRLGAYDFIIKPIDRSQLLRSVAKAAEKQRLSAENVQLRKQLLQQRGEEALVGNSATMLAVKKLIRQVASAEVSILIQGESGTGKEIIADVLHSLSQRSANTLVKISCAAIPETLLESELFGYEKGAFTGATSAKPGKFEVAHEGTLFLDEIAEMSAPLQAKLLRILQDGRFQHLGGTKDIQVNVRVISATHVDLQKAIQAHDKKFREDLFYRLNVVQITVPPLRDRREDIPLLANHFLLKHAARMRKQVRAISQPAMEQLLMHTWPGNVRELENTIQRACAVSSDDTIDSFQLITSPTLAPAVAAQPSGPAVTIQLGTPLEAAEDTIIGETLRFCAGDKEKAAHMLGISSRTLYRRFSKDIPRETPLPQASAGTAPPPSQAN